jgi:curved DNA-binding protein CbpA
MVGTQEDFYALLQIPPGASQDEVAAAYTRLKELYSPGRLEAGPPEFQELGARRRAELQTAYTILSDPARRAAYDQQRAPAGGAAPLDYRPLPPARRRERPSPSIPLPLVDAATRNRQRRGRRSLLGPLIVGLVTLGILLLLVLSSVRTQAGGRALATPAIPNLQLPYTADQIREARAKAEQTNTAETWAAYGHALYDNMEQMRENAPLAPQYLNLLPQWLQAAEAYNRALALGGGPDVRADRALALFYHGVSANDQASIARGLAEAQQALKAGPDDPRVLLSYGSISAGLNPPRKDEAVRAWQRILQVAPQSREAGPARDLLAANGQTK